MRVAEIQSIMQMLKIQQKECNCELIAYQRVRAAYRSYRSYLVKLEEAKTNKYKAKYARAMSLRFMKLAVSFRRRAMMLQRRSVKYSVKAKQTVAKYVLFSGKSKVSLSKYQMTIKKY